MLNTGRSKNIGIVDYLNKSRESLANSGSLETLLPWLRAENVQDFSQHISDLPNLPNQATALLQQRASNDFHHRAGTLTNGVALQISRLSTNHVVRVSHQPNAFAYSRLIGQFFAVDALSKMNSNRVPLYYFIDYDVVTNNRFGKSVLPDQNSLNGAVTLGLPNQLLRRHKNSVAYLVPIPERQWVDEVIDLLKKSTQGYSSQKLCDDNPLPRLERIISDIEFAWQNARNVAEMNAIILSRFVNLWLGLDIPFVPGSQIWSGIAAKTLREFLPKSLELYREIGHAQAELSNLGISIKTNETSDSFVPWWHVCECNSRVQLTTICKIFTGVCSHCNMKVKFSADEVEHYAKNSTPRILLHNWLNHSDFGYALGSSHIGSAEHIVLHSLALTKLGKEPLKQFIWSCIGGFGTLLEKPFPKNTPSPGLDAARRVAINGEASFVYFALCQSIELFKQQINQKILA